MHIISCLQVELDVMDNVLCAADYGPMINDGHLCTETNYGKQVKVV